MDKNWSKIGYTSWVFFLCECKNNLDELSLLSTLTTLLTSNSIDLKRAKHPIHFPHIYTESLVYRRLKVSDVNK